MTGFLPATLWASGFKDTIVDIGTATFGLGHMCIYFGPTDE